MVSGPGFEEDGTKFAPFTFDEKPAYERICFDLKSRMKIALDELQAFVIVVDSGSTAAAARQPGLTNRLRASNVGIVDLPERRTDVAIRIGVKLAPRNASIR
ncbi:LysR family transcriptional regulator [Paraburkholderia bengalensis]|uniref:helix-turn-helix domain-containing protein n=1 Tax=Paraburkholderia bengalensis TaxID=2747562 RepID=UPI003AF51778